MTNWTTVSGRQITSKVYLNYGRIVAGSMGDEEGTSKAFESAAGDMDEEEAVDDGWSGEADGDSGADEAEAGAMED